MSDPSGRTLAAWLPSDLTAPSLSAVGSGHRGSAVWSADRLCPQPLELDLGIAQAPPGEDQPSGQDAYQQDTFYATSTLLSACAWRQSGPAARPEHPGGSPMQWRRTTALAAAAGFAANLIE
ncbi:MAG: hypothetical protein ACXVFA_15320 [Solirubrobacteraceae bacterium]